MKIQVVFRGWEFAAQWLNFSASGLNLITYAKQETINTVEISIDIIITELYLEKHDFNELSNAKVFFV